MNQKPSFKFKVEKRSLNKRPIEEDSKIVVPLNKANQFILVYQYTLIKHLYIWRVTTA